MRAFIKPFSVALLLSFSASSFAGILPIFSGWTAIDAEDGVGAGGYVGPGWGGQNFDAEYLFVKQTGNTLSIGLQTGFDTVSQNGQNYGGGQYYSGDLALSFDGNNSQYEYAVDFGKLAKGYFSQQTVSSLGVNVGSGIDAAGLYSVSSWNNDIYFHASVPYAMSGGSLLLAATGLNYQEGSGYVGGDKSYYNIFTFDLSNIPNLASNFDLGAHWTMSCGNDALDGEIHLSKVFEPSPLILLGLGLFGLTLQRRKA